VGEQDSIVVAAARQLTSYAELAFRNSQPVRVWGGGLEGEHASWIGCDEETCLVSVQLATGGMVHMLPGALIGIRAG
jgi:hypothetical protein